MSKHWDPDWLREKYIEEKMDSYEMAELTDVSSSAVLNQMEKHGIERRCPEEVVEMRWGDDRLEVNRAFYSRDRWQKTAAEIRDRDDHRCVSCGKEQSELGKKLHIHHIKPLRECVDKNGEVTEEAYDAKNLISLCNRCHGLWESLPVRPQVDI